MNASPQFGKELNFVRIKSSNFGEGGWFPIAFPLQGHPPNF